MSKVKILMDCFGRFSNATPVGKVTEVPEKIAKEMVKYEFAERAKGSSTGGNQ